MKTTTRKTAKTTKAKTAKAPKTKPAAKVFEGTIPATRVFQKDLTEQFAAKQSWKKTATVPVHNWMILNEAAGTVTYCNTYHNAPRASYDPATYTYSLEGRVLKVATKKMDEFVEVEVTDWPSFITPAKRKAKSK